MKTGREGTKQLIEGLRAVADFYEQNPAAYDDGMRLTLNMYAWGAEACTAMRETARAFGSCTRHIDHRNITISHDFGDRVRLAIFISRESACLGGRLSE